MPEYEPRGCPRGASFSWYQYSPLRVKYPYVRGELLAMFREARERTGDPGRGVGVDRRGPGARALLQVAARQGRVRPGLVGGGARAHRRGPRAHHPTRGAGPDRRLLPHPRDVDGLLRGGHALPVAHRRRLPVVLRLVRRPAAGLAPDLGRPDRRARVGGLVGRRLHDHLGDQHPADADAGRPLHGRGPLPGSEGGRRVARLRGAHQVRRPLAAGGAGHRRGAGARDGARDPARVLRRAQDARTSTSTPAGPRTCRSW